MAISQKDRQKNFKKNHKDEKILIEGYDKTLKEDFKKFCDETKLNKFQAFKKLVEDNKKGA